MYYTFSVSKVIKSHDSFTSHPLGHEQTTKKTASVGEDVEKWAPGALLVGVQYGDTVVKNSVVLHQKIKDRITI